MECPCRRFLRPLAVVQFFRSCSTFERAQTESRCGRTFKRTVLGSAKPRRASPDSLILWRPFGCINCSLCEATRASQRRLWTTHDGGRGGCFIKVVPPSPVRVVSNSEGNLSSTPALDACHSVLAVNEAVSTFDQGRIYGSVDHLPLHF